MLFNSIAFLFFFLVVHQVFWRLPQGWHKYWLLLASLFFYGYWSIPFLFHFVSVILVSFLFLKLLERKHSKAILALILAILLANLIFFKYTNSVLSILAEDFGWQGAAGLKKELGLILPLAISFYTFQIIAFIVDYWRGEIKKLDFWDFSVFILFFPQLIAGPIMRHHEFLDRLNRPEWEDENLPVGIFQIGFGVIKKVLIADRISVLIDPVWQNPGHYDNASILAAMIGFIAQVYCDFSGYTDMARGTARLLGYKIPENFYAPYLSVSFTDLWRRWHVTLATWLRDYLFIPLGGSRGSVTRTYVNIMIVMCLGGLWHGNTYNFFIWGFWSGLFLVGEKMLGLDKGPTSIPGKIFGNLIVLVAWTVGAVFFRAPDLQTVFGMARGLIETHGEQISHIPEIWQLFAATLVLQAIRKYANKTQIEWLLQRWNYLIPAYTMILFFLVVRIENPAEEFIYFRF